MFKCSLKKHWRLIKPHKTQVVFFFPGEWSDTSPRNVEHPKLLTIARRVPAQVMSFWKPEVIFLIIWSADEVQHTNKSNTWTKKTFQTPSWLPKTKQHFNTYISNFQAVCEFINTPLKNPSQFSSSWPHQRVFQKTKQEWSQTQLAHPFQALYSHHILFVFSGRKNWKTAVFSLISHPHPQPNWEGSPPKLLES